MKVKDIWNKNKNKVALVGVVLATGVATYFAAQKGFANTLEGYSMDVHLFQGGVEVLKPIL